MCKIALIVNTSKMYKYPVWNRNNTERQAGKQWIPIFIVFTKNQKP